MNEEKIVKMSGAEEASASAVEEIGDVRDYLRGIRHRYAYAQVLCERAQRYREMAMKATGRVDAVRLSGTPMRSRVEDNVLAMLDTHAELKRQSEDLVRESRKAEKLIATLGDIRHRTVLQLRYLCGMRWDEIAEKMHFTQRWVHKLHREAIEALEKRTL